MTVTVLFFAYWAERLGRTSIGVELSEGSTVSSVLDSVRSLPGGSGLPPRPMVAVNRTYARPDTVLANGDEVAIIPPVAGG